MSNDKLTQQCKWEKDDVKCNKTAIKDGYCQEHYENRGTNTLGGAVGGIVVASLLTANPLFLIGAAVFGGLLGASANKKDDQDV